jgi:hypothetical protein
MSMSAAVPSLEEAKQLPVEGQGAGAVASSSAGAAAAVSAGETAPAPVRLAPSGPKASMSTHVRLMPILQWGPSSLPQSAGAVPPGADELVFFDPLHLMIILLRGSPLSVMSTTVSKQAGVWIDYPLT